MRAVGRHGSERRCRCDGAALPCAATHVRTEPPGTRRSAAGERYHGRRVASPPPQHTSAAEPPARGGAAAARPTRPPASRGFRPHDARAAHDPSSAAVTFRRVRWLPRRTAAHTARRLPLPPLSPYLSRAIDRPVSTSRAAARRRRRLPVVQPRPARSAHRCARRRRPRRTSSSTAGAGRQSHVLCESTQARSSRAEENCLRRLLKLTLASSSQSIHFLTPQGGTDAMDVIVLIGGSCSPPFFIDPRRTPVPVGSRWAAPSRRRTRGPRSGDPSQPGPT